MKKIITIILILASFGLKAQNDLNRTKVKDSIQALTATITRVSLLNLLDDNFANSVVFRTSNKKSIVAAANAATADFDTLDFIEVDAGGDLVNITITNTKDGDLVHLKVINKAGAAISFIGADNVTDNGVAYLAADSVTFSITNMNDEVLAEAIYNTINTATATNSGILEVATTAEAQALTLDTKIITPLGLSDVIGDIAIHIDTVAIGAWNINTAQFISVSYTATYSNIIDIRGIIYNDANTTAYPMGAYSLAQQDAQIGVFSFTSNNINLAAETGGSFDGADFESRTNRGWLIIYSIP